MIQPVASPLSRSFLLERGYCCGNGCFNCPYVDSNGNRHQPGSTIERFMHQQSQSHMTVTEFTEKWSISVSAETEYLLQQAITICEQSMDPLHDQNHIYRLLGTLDTMMVSEEFSTNRSIQWEVLLLAICWHDVWKSAYSYTHVVSLLFSFWWEALGSMKIFNKAAQAVNLPKSIRVQAAYAIRKHHSVQFLKRKTLEAKILKDLDELDIWSVERVDEFNEYYQQRPKPMRGFKKLVGEYMKIKNKRSFKTLYFNSSRELLAGKQERFFKRLEELMGNG